MINFNHLCSTWLLGFVLHVQDFSGFESPVSFTFPVFILSKFSTKLLSTFCGLKFTKTAENFFRVHTKVTLLRTLSSTHQIFPRAPKISQNKDSRQMMKFTFVRNSKFTNFCEAQSLAIFARMADNQKSKKLAIFAAMVLRQLHEKQKQDRGRILS